MSNEKSIYKNTIYSILLRVFNIAVPVIVGAYPLNIFGADLMGTANYSESIYNYFMIFASFGMYNYALREISRIRNDKKKVAQMLTSFFIFGVATHLVVAVIYFAFITIRFKGQFIYPVAILYGINMIHHLFYIEWLNEAQENYNFITIKTIVNRCIYIVLLFTLVRTKNDFLIYVFLNTLNLFLNNIISYWYIKKSIRFDFSNIEIKKHIRPLAYIAVIANADILYTQLDKVLLGASSKKGLYSSVAFYNTPQLIVSLITPMILSIVAVTVPRLSNVIYEKGHEEYEKLLSKITTICFMFLFPVGIGLCLYSRETILLYARNKEFIGAINVLQIFSIYLIITGIGSVFTNQIMYVKKKETVLFKLLLVCGVLNVIFKIALSKLGTFTPVTAILTTTISNFILIVLQYIYIRTKLKMEFNIFNWEKMKYFAYSLLFIPITLLLRGLNLSTLLMAIIGVSINALLYIGILYFTKDSVFLTLLEKITKKAR